jgi:Gnt-I system low-affinity gluconate transporter
MDFILANRAVIATGLSVVILLWLILKWRVPAFAALIGVSLLAALGAGLGTEAAYDTVIRGMGGTLGFIAVIVGLGSLFGAILESGGGLPKLASGLLARGKGQGGETRFGLIGLLASIPVFFDVALIILAPMAWALSSQSKRSVMAYGLPLLVGLAIAHAFIPPTPGPVAVAEIVGAQLSWVILAGLLAGLPSFFLAGPLLTRQLERMSLLPDVRADHVPAVETGSGGISALTVISLILTPLVLILLASVIGLIGLEGPVASVIGFIGHPFSALLIACLAAAAVTRTQGPQRRERMNGAIARALEPAGAVILVTGAGGAFKQVLVESGAGAQLADIALAAGLIPIVAGYVLALIVRVAQGSATVAMITAAGLAAPLLEAVSASAWDRAVLVIAIAAGASALSHVNDSGFWLVSRIFRLSEAQTLRTWTLATLVLSLSGLVMALMLSMVA